METSNTPPTIDNNLIQQFIENQIAEGKNRKEALELKKQQLVLSHQYALQLLETQKQDLANQRTYNQKALSKNIILIFGILILLLLFGGFCLCIGKDEILKEIFKMLMVALPTALGGYFYGYNKGKKTQDTLYEQEDPEE